MEPRVESLNKNGAESNSGRSFENEILCIKGLARQLGVLVKRMGFRAQDAFCHPFFVIYFLLSFLPLFIFFYRFLPRSPQRLKRVRSRTARFRCVFGSTDGYGV
jgi:hypothetical protein